jgi:uncharacterized protein (TIGR03083 family)
VTQTIDVGAAYRELRIRVLDLVRELTDSQWETIVPHCPEWTIRQTLAHLAGVVDDGINGNMTGVATDPWTKAHVDKRAEKTGPEIAEEWATWAPFVEARASEAGLALSQLLFDAVSHEHDLRFALNKPGARTSAALDVALHFLVTRFQQRAGGSPIRLTINGVERITADQAKPDAPLLDTTAFDAVRSIGSRRSKAEVLSLGWTPTPSNAVLDDLPPFGYRTNSLHE